MLKHKIVGQGEIIDKIRKVRADLWREYKGNMQKLHENSRKLVKQLGMRYGAPKKKKDHKQAA